MGKLAVWGGVAGAGKGVVANAEQSIKENDRRLEEAREMRMRQFEAEKAAERQASGFKHAEGLQGKGFEHDDEMLKKEQGFKTEEANKGRTAEQEALDKKLKSDASEGAADRENRLKVAEIGAGARASSASTKPRWTFSQSQETVIGENSIPMPRQVTYVRDTHGMEVFKKVGAYYLPQSDDKYKNTPPESARQRAGKAALQWLAENPERSKDFVAKYHYLPEWFIQNDNSSASGDLADDE